MSYTVYDPKTGRILRSGYASPLDIEKQALPGEAVLHERSNDKTHYVDIADCVLTPLPSQPAPHHVFDWEIKAWVVLKDAIEMARAARCSYINLARDTALQKLTVEYNGETYRADAGSFSSITNTLVLASEQQEIPWRSEGNSITPLNVGALRVLAVKMRASRQDIYERSWICKKQIETAQTVEAVNAVNLI